MRKIILTAAIALAFCTGGLGVMSLKNDVRAQAMTTGAEWTTGNDTVTATFNYDITNSDYATWAFTEYDTNMNVQYNNADNRNSKSKLLNLVSKKGDTIL